MNPSNVYIKPNEGKFLAMAVLGMIETLQASAANPKLPWDPQTRKDIKDMLEAGKGLRIKLAKLGFDMRDLPDYTKGEENDYFTKES